MMTEPVGSDADRPVISPDTKRVREHRRSV
jgi:hypothetical protein